MNMMTYSALGVVMNRGKKYGNIAETLDQRSSVQKANNRRLIYCLHHHLTSFCARSWSPSEPHCTSARRSVSADFVRNYSLAHHLTTSPQVFYFLFFLPLLINILTTFKLLEKWQWTWQLCATHTSVQ